MRTAALPFPPRLGGGRSRSLMGGVWGVNLSCSPHASRPAAPSEPVSPALSGSGAVWSPGGRGLSVGQCFMCTLQLPTSIEDRPPPANSGVLAGTHNGYQAYVGTFDRIRALGSLTGLQLLDRFTRTLLHSSCCPHRFPCFFPHRVSAAISGACQASPSTQMAGLCPVGPFPVFKTPVP